MVNEMHGFIKNLTWLTSPDVLNIFLRFLTGLVTAKILGPENLGIASAIGLIYVYFPLLQLGIGDGLNLKTYALKAKASPLKEKIILAHFHTAYNFVNIILLAGSLCLLAALSFHADLNSVIWLGVFAYIGVVFLDQFANYSLAYARFQYFFKTVGIAQTVGHVLKAVIIVILTYHYHLPGLFAALFLSYALTALFIRVKVPVRFGLRFKKSYAQSMIKLGFPLIVIGSLLTLFQGIDKWFILGFMNTTQLGLYSIVITFASALMIFPIKAVSLLIQYTREYYYKTRNLIILLRAYLQFITIGLLVYAILTIAGEDILFYIFRYYLIKYLPSYPLVNVILLATYFSIIFHALGGLFAVINHKKYTVIALGASLVMAVLLNGLSLWIDGTIYGIAVATALSAFCLCGFMFMSFRSICRKNQIDLDLWKYFLIIGTILGVFVGIMIFVAHDPLASLRSNILISVIRLVGMSVMVGLILWSCIIHKRILALQTVVRREEA